MMNMIMRRVMSMMRDAPRPGAAAVRMVMIMSISLLDRLCLICMDAHCS